MESTFYHLTQKLKKLKTWWLCIDKHTNSHIFVKSDFDIGMMDIFNTKRRQEFLWETISVSVGLVRSSALYIPSPCHGTGLFLCSKFVYSCWRTPPLVGPAHLSQQKYRQRRRDLLLKYLHPSALTFCSSSSLRATVVRLPLPPSLTPFIHPVKVRQWSSLEKNLTKLLLLGELSPLNSFSPLVYIAHLVLERIQVKCCLLVDIVLFHYSLLRRTQPPFWVQSFLSENLWRIFSHKWGSFYC